MNENKVSEKGLVAAGAQDAPAYPAGGAGGVNQAMGYPRPSAPGFPSVTPTVLNPAPTFESRVDEIIKFVQVYMPHEFTTKLDVLNSIVWVCPCNKDIHPLLDRFCQSCGGFPTANSSIRYVTRKSE